MRKHEVQQGENRTTPENLLYHYTAQEGLYGILTSSCIWATDYRFLNDTSERQHAVTLFAEAFSRQAAYGPATGLGADIKKHLSDRKQSSIEAALRSLDAYYVCFTKEELNPQLPLTSDVQFLGDRLSQWRGYAQNRQGFSLGFHRDRLLLQANHLQTTTQAQISIELLDCVYGDERKMAIVSTMTGNSPMDPNILRKCMAEFKHEEKESRLVIQMPVDQTDLGLVEFRNGLFGRTPYVRVPLGLKGQDSPLERIVVGPSPYMDQTVQSLESELAKLGIQGVKVVPSGIPYRN